jgi:hypothetical protein
VAENIPREFATIRNMIIKDSMAYFLFSSSFLYSSPLSTERNEWRIGTLDLKLCLRKPFIEPVIQRKFIVPLSCPEPEKYQFRFVANKIAVLVERCDGKCAMDSKKFRTQKKIYKSLLEIKECCCYGNKFIFACPAGLLLQK